MCVCMYVGIQVNVSYRGMYPSLSVTILLRIDRKLSLISFFVHVFRRIQFVEIKWEQFVCPSCLTILCHSERINDYTYLILQYSCVHRPKVRRHLSFSIRLSRKSEDNITLTVVIQINYLNSNFAARKFYNVTLSGKFII